MAAARRIVCSEGALLVAERASSRRADDGARRSLESEVAVATAKGAGMRFVKGRKREKGS